jgi:hypothetical protein
MYMGVQTKTSRQRDPDKMPVQPVSKTLRPSNEPYGSWDGAGGESAGPADNRTVGLMPVPQRRPDFMPSQERAIKRLKSNPEQNGLLDDIERLKVASNQAESARRLLGPYWGVLMNLELKDDSQSQAIDVLLLGERHDQPFSVPQSPDEISMQTFLQAAAYRAAYGSSPRCCDIFIEYPSIDRKLPEWYPSCPGTLAHLCSSLAPCIPESPGVGIRSEGCPLGRHQVRVHAFDTRAPRVQMHLVTEEFVQDWMYFFMGLDLDGQVTLKPFPQRFFVDYASMHSMYMPDLMRFHTQMVKRVQRRAHKLGVERAERIAQLVIDTAPMTRHVFKIQSHASNFYLVLRMLAPSRVRPSSPCVATRPGGTVPRCCIVYAGQSHTEHVRDILMAIEDIDFDVQDHLGRIKLPNTGKHPLNMGVRGLPVADIGVDYSRRVSTVGELLLGLNLGIPGPTQPAVADYLPQDDPQDDNLAAAIARKLGTFSKARRYRVGTFSKVRRYRVGDRYLVLLHRDPTQQQQQQQQQRLGTEVLEMIKLATDQNSDREALSDLDHVLTEPPDTPCEVALLTAPRDVGVGFAVLTYEVSDGLPYDLEGFSLPRQGWAEMSHCNESHTGLAHQLLRLVMDDARTRLKVKHVLIRYPVDKVHQFSIAAGARQFPGDDAPMLVFDTDTAAGAMNHAELLS